MIGQNKNVGFREARRGGGYAGTRYALNKGTAENRRKENFLVFGEIGINTRSVAVDLFRTADGKRTGQPL